MTTINNNLGTTANRFTMGSLTFAAGAPGYVFEGLGFARGSGGITAGA